MKRIGTLGATAGLFYSTGHGLGDKVKSGFFGLLTTGMFRPGSRMRRMFPRVEKAVEVRPAKLNGGRIAIYPQEWSEVAVYKEIFVEDVYDLSLVPYYPEVIMDWGGHIGLFSLIAKTTFPESKLRAYEPNPQNFQRLKAHVERNSIDAEVFDMAVSIKEGETEFSFGNDSLGGAIGTAGGNKENQVVVTLLDAKALIESIGEKKLLLKIDVEGEERDIIPRIAPILPRHTTLFFEVHHGDSYRQELVDCLNREGFEVTVTRDNGGCCDAVAVRSD